MDKILDHLGYILAMAGLVYLHWLRSRVEIITRSGERDEAYAKHLSDVMEAYRRSNNNELRLLHAVMRAERRLRESGFAAEADDVLAAVAESTQAKDAKE